MAISKSIIGIVVWIIIATKAICISAYSGCAKSTYCKYSIRLILSLTSVSFVLSHKSTTLTPVVILTMLSDAVGVDNIDNLNGSDELDTFYQVGDFVALDDVKALDDVGPLNDFEEHLLGLFSGVSFCGLIITPKSVTTLGVSMPFN